MDSHLGWSVLLLLAVSVVLITQQCPHRQGPSLDPSCPFTHDPTHMLENQLDLHSFGPWGLGM